MVKNLPAMWETWVQSLAWEDPLEEEMATHSSILAWETMPRHLFEGNPVDEGTTRRGTDTPVHRPEKTAGYSYSSTSACHSVNNSKGKRRSIPPRKTRRDSLVRTRQVLCDPSLVRSYQMVLQRWNKVKTDGTTGLH